MERPVSKRRRRLLRRYQSEIGGFIMQTIRCAVLLALVSTVSSAQAASQLEMLQGALADLARLQELRAINQTEAVLGQGPSPSHWPLSAFLEMATIKSAIEVLDESTTMIPVGKVRNN